MMYVYKLSKTNCENKNVGHRNTSEANERMGTADQGIKHSIEVI